MAKTKKQSTNASPQLYSVLILLLIALLVVLSVVMITREKPSPEVEGPFPEAIPYEHGE